MRSAKVPLSPSSALHTMYFVDPGGVEHGAPLDAGGERGAAAAAQAAVGHLGDDLAWLHLQRSAQADQAAVGLVVLGRAWVDDTDPLERDALLADHPRQLVGEAESQGMIAAREQTGSDQAGHVGAS